MSSSLTPLRQLAKRLHPHLRGWLAEKLALVSYMACGYLSIRHLRTTLNNSLAQTDLILCKNNTIILVEVKYRSSRTRGHVAVGQGQQARLHRQLTAVSGRYPGYTVRLELFLVFPHWPFGQRIRQPYL